MDGIDNPQGSRLFIVCGKNVEAEVLQVAFKPFGDVQNVKLIKEKGVAYVKYDKASSAALAMESLNGAVLNNGRGPKLKVLLAEAPNTTRSLQPPRPMEQELSSDPDNIPPRSRLFLVVPKQADPQQINDAFAAFEGLEYCKTDLVATKGVAFCKFTKASSALKALEDVTSRGTVASYKVKCMLAEPKTKQRGGRVDGSPQDAYSPMMQAAKLDYGMGHHMQPDASHMLQDLPVGHALSPAQMQVADYSSIGGLAGLSGLGGFNHLGDANNLNNMNNLANMQSQLAAAQALGFNPGAVGLGNLHTNSASVSPHTTSPQLSKQRLFVVVHKTVTEDMLARLFRRFHGMEYCDLKKDRTTGKSKGYCYVNYSTPEAAAAAVEQLNGIEFPPHSNNRIKVMFAEQLGVPRGQHQHQLAHSGGSHSPAAMSLHTSPSPVHTPVSRNLSPDVTSVQESLANMSIPRVGSTSMMDDMEQARRMASPMQTHVARELLFNAA